MLSEIKQGRVELTEVGKVVERTISELPTKYPMAKVASHVIMPDHVHMLIDLRSAATLTGNDSSNGASNDSSNGASNGAINRAVTGTVTGTVSAVTSPDRAGTGKTTTTDLDRIRGGVTGEHNPMLKNNSISSMIRWLKAKSCYQIRCFCLEDFQWHPRYHDRIVRNRKEREAFLRYIEANPAKWENVPKQD